MITRKRHTEKQCNRRYKLHQKIKAHFNYDAKEMYISIPAGKADSISEGLPKNVNKALTELRERFGYNLQTVIEYPPPETDT